MLSAASSLDRGIGKRPRQRCRGAARLRPASFGFTFRAQRAAPLQVERRSTNRRRSSSISLGSPTVRSLRVECFR
jgi:hypothetical protein